MRSLSLPVGRQVSRPSCREVSKRRNESHFMIDEIFELKGWQLFLILSTYWLAIIFIDGNSIWLDVILITNTGLLFTWYYLIIQKLVSITNINVRLLPLYILMGLYLLGYMLIELLAVENKILTSVFWQYLAIIGYIFNTAYVALNFEEAEERKGTKSGIFLSTFTLFFVYPVGVFFISRRLKKLLTP